MKVLLIALSFFLIACDRDPEPSRFATETVCDEQGECLESKCSREGGAIGGAVAGFFLAGPLGAVAGAVIGNAADDETCIKKTVSCCKKEHTESIETEAWREWKERQKPSLK